MKSYQFLVTLNNVKPKVWRRFLVPTTFDFFELHSVIQISVGWTNSHLFNFLIADSTNNKTIELVADEESVEENFGMIQHYMKNPPEKGSFDEKMYQRLIRIQLLLARDVTLSQYVVEFPEFSYMYDFGDGWEHEIVMEKVVEDYNHDYPQVLEGKGTCPPEDVGGPPGYDEFKRVIKDKEDPEHAHMNAWGKEQGYKKFNLAKVNASLMEEWV
ncbi:plasmid pRiA4b ORF-3 family protein [Paenisporosarcina sp. TG20]|uniref:plasmid pRiA4b ORF-3 family protein n=1 Tax=Paenisporosarcina sp. TG20 TaxID=1211706 RepID=UPI00031832B8|nr:plasmid pRiA4b ORF-3 family protein [Paenisporosarcina sp. TG20]